VIALILSACNAIELLEPEFYEGCCSKGSVQDTLGSTAFFIPNAITPNDDEVNDAFSIFSDKRMRIKSLNVSERHGILSITRANIPVRGWTDIWVPKNASAIPIYGIYDYQMTLVDQAGVEKLVTGEFCALSCISQDAEIIPLQQCHFSTQSDELGHLNDTLPNLEPCL
jgi:hypothetical protein